MVENLLIAVDPGHGGKDPGALIEGYKEKDINLSVALKLRDILTKNGIDVIMTRDKDKTVDLQQRCDIANQAHANYFISIHCNSFQDPSASGTETYAYPGSVDGRNLAQYVQNEIVKMLGTKDRGVKYEKFYVLKYTDMPAILVELAFMSNPHDLKLLLEKDDLFAEAISRGLENFLKTTFTGEEMAIQKLKMKGIIDKIHDTKSYVTWGEFASVIIKVLEGMK